MKLTKIKAEHFGKLNQVTLQFDGGINVVRGGNESGKSTLHGFVRAMLFGLPRMRGRAARNDAYSRCEPWDYAGVYGGKIWLECGGKIFRLSRSFQKERPSAELVCETDGELLSVERGDLQMLLGDIAEETYENTVSVGQQSGVTGGALVQRLRDYMSGCQEGMDAGLNLKKATEQLRSRRRKMQNDIRAAALKEEEKLERLTDKIQEQREIIEQLRQEQREIQAELPRKGETGHRMKSGGEIKQTAAAGVIWLLLALGAFWLASGVIRAVLLAGLGSLGIWAAWRTYQKRKSASEEEFQTQVRQEAQREKIQWQADELKRRLGEEESRLMNLEDEYEKLQRAAAERSPLQADVDALELAEKRISELSGQMQGKMSRSLQERVSQIFCALTQGKYDCVELDHEMKMGVHTKERYIPADRLSRGTLEQLYLALRLGAGELLCREETMPLLLDETFAMYDDDRLAKTLLWLSEYDRQVILFTCQEREEQILKTYGIPYHRIVLE